MQNVKLSYIRGRWGGGGGGGSTSKAIGDVPLLCNGVALNP